MKMSIDFDVDSELQIIADEVTKYGLYYCGATFEHAKTGTEFDVTVSKSSSVFDLTERVKELEEALAELNKTASSVVDLINCNEDSMLDFTNAQYRAKQLLEKE